MIDSVINSLTVYYGEAIQNFPGDVDGMYRAIWAVFHHSLSNDEKHDHQFCPPGSDSWCKYNRALANNEEAPKHTPKFPMDLSPFIKPVFTELSKLELLEKCVLGATQNQNESFNNIVWSRCPKTGFCSRVSIEIAVYLAGITFNHGLEGLSPLFEKLFGFPPRAFTADYIASSDSKRIKNSVQKAEHTGQKRRTLMRSTALATEEKHIAREGITYEPGGFSFLGGFFIFKVFFLTFIWSTNAIFLTVFFLYMRVCMCECVCVGEYVCECVCG